MLLSGRLRSTKSEINTPLNRPWIDNQWNRLNIAFRLLRYDAFSVMLVTHRMIEIKLYGIDIGISWFDIKSPFTTH